MYNMGKEGNMKYEIIFFFSNSNNILVLFAKPAMITYSVISIFLPSHPLMTLYKNFIRY